MRGEQIPLLSCLRYKFVKEFHPSLGRPGNARTLYAVAKKYVLEGMQYCISDYRAHCCLRNKANHERKCEQRPPG